MENFLRKVAKSYYYQFLYIKSKETGNIKLFQNDMNFSHLQIIFMQWLEVYTILYNDLNKNEKFISQDVIDDELRTDAYLFYKSKNKNIDINKSQVDTNSNLPSVVFKRGRK